jgi:hypothetical protein
MFLVVDVIHQHTFNAPLDTSNISTYPLGQAIPPPPPPPTSNEWRVTWDDDVTYGNSTYMRTGELGMYDKFYEPTESHSPLPYNSITGGYNVLYDGNAGQYNLQNNSGPYSYTINFTSPFQLFQVKIGSTDGGAANSIGGHPSGYVKFEYKDTDTNSWKEHSIMVLRDVPDSSTGSATWNNNGGTFPFQPSSTFAATSPFIGNYGMNMFRWNGNNWYHYKAYGDNMVITYPKIIDGVTYY